MTRMSFCSRGALLGAVVLALVSARANAEVLWEDDFNSHSNYTSTWYDGTADADPDSPPWTTTESRLAAVQIMRWPIGLASNQGNAITPINQEAGEQYLHMFNVGGSSYTVGAFPGAAQDQITTWGNARLEADVYNYVDIGGPGGWGGDTRLAVYGDVGGALELRFQADGAVEVYLNYDPDGAGPWVYTWQEIPAPSAVWSNNAWQRVAVDFDLASDQAAVTIGGTTVSGIPLMMPGDYTTLTGVRALVPYATGIYPRAAYDNFSLTAIIPEPSSIALLGIGLAVLLGFGRRRRRYRNVN